MQPLIRVDSFIPVRIYVVYFFYKVSDYARGDDSSGELSSGYLRVYHADDRVLRVFGREESDERALLLAGALICAANGSGETAQSSIIGTIFTPANRVATKISNGITYVFGEASGNAEYLRRIDYLEQQVGALQDQLSDYENLQKQNALYKDALGLKEENPDFTFVEASVTGRDAADIFGSYTISKGTASGIKEGDAVLYGNFLNRRFFP